jgi:hypothetical protein
MAVAKLKVSTSGWSQWVVVYPNGREERCHNQATARTLANTFNRSPLRREMKWAVDPSEVN